MFKSPKEYPVIVILRLENGHCQPLAWSSTDVSKKDLRRATKKFMNDSDVVGYGTTQWYRLYNTITEAKADTPEFK